MLRESTAMKSKFFVLLLFFTYSCKGSRIITAEETYSYDIVGGNVDVEEESLGTDDIKPKVEEFSITYQIEGIPQAIHRSSKLTLSFRHNGLSAIYYSLAPKCNIEWEYIDLFQLHIPNDPLELNFSNLHGTVKLCLRGVDYNGLIEPEVKVFEWIQGFPDLINNTLKSDCEVIDDVESFRVAIRLSQQKPGEPLIPKTQNELYNNGGCLGSPLASLPLIIENVSLEESGVSMIIDDQQWYLKFVFNEINIIQHFEQELGPFGTKDRVFVFTNNL